MTANLPIVSVIIPAYNRDRYLAEAIESVLAQTYSAIDIIVVDDGSVDRTAEVAQRYVPKIRYFYQPNGGIGAARNAGIAQAQGEFLAFLDSDDLWVPNKLALQLAAFASDPELDAVFGYIQQFYSPEVDEAYRQRIRCPEAPIAAYLSTSVLIRRSTFFQVGGFNTKAGNAVDVEWYGRVVEQQLKMLLLPDVVYHRRLHHTNNGVINPQYSDRLRVLKAMLDRRRQMQYHQS